MSKLSNFNEYINEASLKGNIGIPGEGGSQDDSWLNRIRREKGERMAEFERQHRTEIMNFMSLISQSQRIQSGKEEELSELTKAAFIELFGSLLDDIELDFKISNESREMLQQTPDDSEDQEQASLEKLEDEKIINEIHKRKILRTLQQGKGLTSKAILNLPMFKKGLKDILGERESAEYLRILNAISKVAQFNDWRLPDNIIQNFLRMSSAGACEIQFPEDAEKSEETEDLAKKILDDLEQGKDIIDSEATEELLSNLNITIKARGIDLSVLVHEAIKGIYMLPLQLSLEHLTEEEAETVILNTDTLLDEAEEFKYGPEMQKAFDDTISKHPKVSDIIYSYMRIINSDDSDAADSAWNELGAFQEKIAWLVYGQLATLGKENPKDMLDVVYAVLSGSESKIEEVFHPIVESALETLDLEAEYQGASSGETEELSDIEKLTNKSEETEEQEDLSTLSKKEIQDLIDDALDAGDMERVKQLAKYLRESRSEKRFNSYLNEFVSFVQLNEQIQAAKDFMLKRYIDLQTKKKKKETPEGEVETPQERMRVSDIPEDLKKKILSDPEFTSVVDLVMSANSPGYGLPFAKMKFLQGASDDVLREILTTLTSLRNVANLLPMPISKYADLTPDDEGSEGYFGYEKLLDDLNKIKILRKGDWLREALPSKAGLRNVERGVAGAKVVNLREEFKNSPKEKQEELLRLGSQIQDIPEKAPAGQLSRSQVMEVVRQLLGRESSIEGVIDAIKKTLEGLDSQRIQILAEISKYEPGVAILYDDDNFLVLSTRSPDAQRDLCKIGSAMCINNWAFASYAKGNMQINVFNFNLPTTEPMHFISATIQPNGSVYHAQDWRNTGAINPSQATGISGRSIRSFFESLNSRKNGNYPEDLISAIESSLDEEIDIKKVTDSLFLDNTLTKSPEALAKFIIDDMQTLMARLAGNPRSNMIMKVAKRIVTTSLQNSDQSFKNKTIVELIKRITATGFSDFSIFEDIKDLLKEAMSPTSISRIIDRNNEIMRQALMLRKSKEINQKEDAQKEKIFNVIDSWVNNTQRTNELLEKWRKELS